MSYMVLLVTDRAELTENDTRSVVRIGVSTNPTPGIFTVQADAVGPDGAVLSSVVFDAYKADLVAIAKLVDSMLAVDGAIAEQFGHVDIDHVFGRDNGPGVDSAGRNDYATRGIENNVEHGTPEAGNFCPIDSATHPADSL